MLENTRRDSDAACIVLLTSNEVLDSQTGIRIQKYNTILKLFFSSINTLLDKTSVCL